MICLKCKSNGTKEKTNYSNNISLWYALKETIKIAWKTSWYWLLCIMFLLILHSTMVSYELVLQNIVIDSVSKITQESLSSVILLIIFFFIYRNITNIVMTIRYLATVWFGPRLDRILRIKMIDKYRKLDLLNYEDAELYDNIERANNSCFMATNAVMGVFQTLSAHVATIIGVMVYLSLLKPQFSLILLFVVVPEMTNHVFKGKKKYEQEKVITPIKRRTEYLNSTITSKEYFKETRILGAFPLLRKLWSQSLENGNEREWKLTRKLFPMEFLVSLANFFAYGATFTLAIYYLYHGEITIGQFTATLTAVGQLRGRLNVIIVNFGKIYQQAMGARFMYTFLNLKEREGKPEEVHPVETITLKDVSFKYNTSSVNAIDKINLELKKGDILAIVGNNGAGKTTFVKLLTGLLNPTSGSVLYNGIDLKDVREDSIYQGTSALFQTFGKYQLTLKENVSLSKTADMDNDEKILQCLDYAGFTIDQEKLPQALNSLLGKDFGGTDLSGGEWQQIGLARAYFRESNLIILDEPTSAIDPIRENQLYEKFVDLCKGKTAVLITHRMSAAKIANKIILMKEGRIAEFGTHEELMALNQSYARMYREQASWYQR